MWRTLDADGCTWEVRVVASEGADEPDTEILEFCTAAPRPPRRLSVQRGALNGMTEDGLQTAYRKSRPIGGDFYGRPGKRMPDAI